ncbi:hypothetical protein Q664_16975 [Archangium violaceum Cb vi76]|uniref:Uncharacterized protein n=1 Tax=Archangium violaceum Cb vi76 TaxID=1406225 RepID=A0A084SUQ9_9BACT|nr:hypothetical protein Q664_16975 [Archangium violaceum Cb vi76]
MAVLDHIPEKFHDHVSEREPCVLQFWLGNEGFRDLVSKGFDLLETIDPLTGETVQVHSAAGRKEACEYLRVCSTLQVFASSLKNDPGILDRACNRNGRTHPHASKEQQLKLLRLRSCSTQPLQEWRRIFQGQGKRALRRHGTTMSTQRSQVNASDAARVTDST